jgi:hypothetical protein
MNLSESPAELEFREAVRRFLQLYLRAAILDDVLEFKHLTKLQYITWQRVLAAQGPHHLLRADRPNLISQRKTAAQLQIESGWRQT